MLYGTWVQTQVYAVSVPTTDRAWLLLVSDVPHKRILFCLQQFIPDGKDALMEVGVLQPDAKQELDQQMAKQQQAPG